MSTAKKQVVDKTTIKNNWYPRNLIIHEEGKKILDEADFSMYLIEIFYRSGYINTEVYMASKKHLKSGKEQ